MTWRGPQAAEGNETACQCAPPSLLVSSVVCLANVPGALGTTVTASPVEAVVKSIADSGRPAFYEADADHIIDRLVPMLKQNEVVAIFSNGGFDRIHEKLLARLKAL